MIWVDTNIRSKQSSNLSFHSWKLLYNTISKILYSNYLYLVELQLLCPNVVGSSESWQLIHSLGKKMINGKMLPSTIWLLKHSCKMKTKEFEYICEKFYISSSSFFKYSNLIKNSYEIVWHIQLKWSFFLYDLGFCLPLQMLISI